MCNDKIKYTLDEYLDYIHACYISHMCEYADGTRHIDSKYIKRCEWCSEVFDPPQNDIDHLRHVLGHVKDFK